MKKKVALFSFKLIKCSSLPWIWIRIRLCQKLGSESGSDKNHGSGSGSAQIDADPHSCIKHIKDDKKRTNHQIIHAFTESVVIILQQFQTTNWGAFCVVNIRV